MTDGLLIMMTTLKFQVFHWDEAASIFILCLEQLSFTNMQWQTPDPGIREVISDATLIRTHVRTENTPREPDAAC